eukprot:scaffold166445_cov33-Tisochrysis_lutea.AAC.1
MKARRELRARLRLPFHSAPLAVVLAPPPPSKRWPNRLMGTLLASYLQRRKLAGRAKDEERRTLACKAQRIEHGWEMGESWLGPLFSSRALLPMRISITLVATLARGPVVVRYVIVSTLLWCPYSSTATRSADGLPLYWPLQSFYKHPLLCLSYRLITQAWIFGRTFIHISGHPYTTHLHLEIFIVI